MSIKCYIIREKQIFVDEEKHEYHEKRIRDNLVRYVHEDQEYAFSISQERLLETMFNFGAEDYTNDDWLGEIEMGKEDFDIMIEHCGIEWNQQDWDSIKTISEYFKEGYNWVIFKCY